MARRAQHNGTTLSASTCGGPWVSRRGKAAFNSRSEAKGDSWRRSSNAPALEIVVESRCSDARSRDSPGAAPAVRADRCRAGRVFFTAAAAAVAARWRVG
jgi:hypothetical protein